MEFVIFSTMLVAAMITGSITRFATKVGLNLADTPFRLFTEVLCFMALVAGMIWGFINIRWYFIVGLFILSGIVAGVLLYRRSFFIFFVKLKPVIDIITVLCCICLWFVW